MWWTYRKNNGNRSKTLTSAKKTLSGLKIEIVYESDSTKANGIVLKQSVAEGTKLKKGDTITLTVNEVIPPEPENEIDPDINDVVDDPNDVVGTNDIVDMNTIE